MNTKRFAIVAASIMMASSAAFAGMLAFESVDKDANGFVSFEELSAVKADVTAEAFTQADADQDGVLNAAEFATIAK